MNDVNRQQFDQHAKILRDGQYRIENQKFIVHAPKIFKKSKEQEVDESTQRIEDLRIEILNLEKELAEKIDQAEKDAQEIIDRAELEAERIVKLAETSAFDRVQKSLDDKDVLLTEKHGEADVIIQQAREEASAIINRARVEAQDIREKAHQEGFNAGKDEGFEFAKDEIKHMVARLHSVIAATIDERARIMVHSENQIVKLILTMVKKIAKQLTDEEQNLVVNNTKEALKLIRGAMRVYIHVNPDDYNYSLSHKEELIGMIEGMPEVKFFQNPKIDKGGVYIETDIGDIDATIATQLEEIESKLKYYMPIKVSPKEDMETEKPRDELEEMKEVDSKSIESSQVIPEFEIDEKELLLKRRKEQQEKQLMEQKLAEEEEKRRREEQEAEDNRRKEGRMKAEEERRRIERERLEEERRKAEELDAEKIRKRREEWEAEEEKRRLEREEAEKSGALDNTAGVAGPEIIEDDDGIPDFNGEIPDIKSDIDETDFDEEEETDKQEDSEA